MMPIFRFHRSTFEESLKTAVYVKDKSDLYFKITRFNNLTDKPIQKDDPCISTSCLRYIDDIIIKDYIFEQIVLVKNQCVPQDTYIIGFLSEPFYKEDE